MLTSRYVSLLALLVAPAVAGAAAAADIPGGPGTGATLALGGPGVQSDLGTSVDSDWFRTTLVADKLYALVLLCEDGDFRLALRGPGGRVLTSAFVGCSVPYNELTQLNFRVPRGGGYFLEVANGNDQDRPPAAYSVRLTTDESSGRADAVRGYVGVRAAGALQSDIDQDFFAFRLEAGKTYDFAAPDLTNRRGYFVQDAAGNNVAASDFGEVTDFVAAYTGDYYVAVQGYTGSGGYQLFVGRSSGPGVGGTPFNDYLTGTAGPDTIDAAGGNDRVDGLAGNDRLNGGPGRDVVLGGAGDDAITGNVGIDTMTGGPGNDRFRYWGYTARSYHSGVGAGQRDRITDFARGDRIDLSAVDADATLVGDQNFALIGGAPFSKPGQVRWRYQGSGTLIQANTDADLTPEFEIELTTRVALRAADFLP